MPLSVEAGFGVLVTSRIPPAMDLENTPTEHGATLAEYGTPQRRRTGDVRAVWSSRVPTYIATGRSASGREPWRDAVGWLSRGRYGRRTGWPRVPRLGTPWQDTISGERRGWRQRAAYLDGHEVFAVDYQVCRRCRLGWVEQPYTVERYQRCGLASAGLAAL
jgi:hypothetical protein